VAEDVFNAYDFRVPLPTPSNEGTVDSVLASLTWEIADELPGRVADTPATWCGYRHVILARRSQQLRLCVDNMVVYIFKLCELFFSTLCEGIDRQRFVARVRRAVLAIGEQNMMDVEALTFLEAMRLLCKRPWSQILPYRVRKHLNTTKDFSVLQKFEDSVKKGSKKAAKIAATAVAAAAALDAGALEGGKGISPAEQMRAMKVAKAKAGGPKDIYERVMNLSNHPENVFCIDCETKVMSFVTHIVLPMQ